MLGTGANVSFPFLITALLALESEANFKLRFLKSLN